MLGVIDPRKKFDCESSEVRKILGCLKNANTRIAFLFADAMMPLLQILGIYLRLLHIPNF